MPVDLELVLAADVSGSVDSTDFALQRDGYEAAFRDASLISKIAGGSIGSIAATLVYWSDSAVQSVGWTRSVTPRRPMRLPNAIAAAGRPSSGSTGMTNALNFSAGLFANDFEGSREVIDVSGDGSESVACSFSNPSCVPLQDARDAFLAGGDDRTINALWIDDRNFFGDDSVDTINALAYGDTNVIGGPGHFQDIVQDFPEFGAAILRKLEREVTSDPVPAPGVLTLFGFGLLGLAFASRRRTG
ncbi:MAG: DUF1194 domain-containing protein [Halofilum sp. (in: g-proteobacteria)]|nr:DUF1194 domain-containing protein [Halofilum sp. (in: g-proteobacteria)]